MNLEKHRADVASKKYFATIDLCYTLERLKIVTFNETQKITENTYASLCPF